MNGRGICGPRPWQPIDPAHINQSGETFAEISCIARDVVAFRCGHAAPLIREVEPMKVITAVLGGTLALLTATSAMAQTAQDEFVCRQWANQYANWAQGQANNQAVGSAFGGALLGAGIGALAGGGRGAAIGAGAGALTGGITGGARAQGAGNQAWFNAFSYCMSTRRRAPPSARQLNSWELNQWR
jgi:hypothetical protein